MIDITEAEHYEMQDAGKYGDCNFCGLPNQELVRNTPIIGAICLTCQTDADVWIAKANFAIERELGATLTKQIKFGRSEPKSVGGPLFSQPGLFDETA